MYGFSLIDKFKSLDVYRKLPSDFVQPTYSGAMLSIISSVIMIFLFISEFSHYMEVKTNSEMFIDVNRGGEKLNINIDIDMLRLPCSLLSLDVQDVMGTHIMNIGGTLIKSRINNQGKVIASEIMTTNEKAKKSDDENDDDHEHDHDHDDNQFDQAHYENVKTSLKNNEGCNIKGYIVVNKVPGNFHISSHAYGGLIQRLASEGYFTFDVSHRINHLSFGEDKDLKYIKRKFGDNHGVLNPLDNSVRNEQQKFVYEYYLKVVPTTYIDIHGTTFYVNQFTSNFNQVNSAMSLPAAFFRFDMSPVTVKYWQYKENLLHFLIQICAIIGGIFSVTGIIDALIHKSIAAILRKANMGKII